MKIWRRQIKINDIFDMYLKTENSKFKHSCIVLDPSLSESLTVRHLIYMFDKKQKPPRDTTGSDKWHIGF